MHSPQPIIWRDSCPSTSADAALFEPTAPHGLTVAAHTQTRGRGQRGNTWEAQPGMNLTFSMLALPQGVAPREQFLVSMAVSRALVQILRPMLPGQCVSIKWPNDIYVADGKLAGILIENTLQGMALTRCIIGVGLNVNQRVFTGDAPNPVSLWGLTGIEHALAPLLGRIAHSLAQATLRPKGDNGLCAWYNANLWRGDGRLHPWRTPAGHVFQAAIQGVEPDGMLTLRHGDGTLHRYAFKEVHPVL